MEAIGADEEVAAVSLGASPWQTFWYITIPNIKWGLLYGVILCNARAMGEFGAVYVVSGHIAGRTDTMPLRVEKLFQEYNTPASFSVASLLTMLALVSLVAKVALERKTRAQLREATAPPEVNEEAGGAATVAPATRAPTIVKSSVPASHMVEISRRRPSAAALLAAHPTAGSQR